MASYTRRKTGLPTGKDRVDGIPGFDHSFLDDDGKLMRDWVPARDSDGALRSDFGTRGQITFRNPLVQVAMDCIARRMAWAYDMRIRLYDEPRFVHKDGYWPMVASYILTGVTASCVTIYGVHLTLLRLRGHSPLATGRHHLATRPSFPPLPEYRKRLLSLADASENLSLPLTGASSTPRFLSSQVSQSTRNSTGTTTIAEQALPTVRASSRRFAAHVQCDNSPPSLSGRVWHRGLHTTTSPKITTLSSHQDEAKRSGEQNAHHSGSPSTKEFMAFILCPPFIVFSVIFPAWQFLKYKCDIRDINHFYETARWVQGLGPIPSFSSPIDEKHRMLRTAIREGKQSLNM